MDDSKKIHCQLEELFNKRQSCSGFEILTGLKLIQDSQLIINLNYIELVDYVQECNQIEIGRIWKNGEYNDYISIQFSRLLHNYLASVYSLISHVRSYVENKEKLKECWEKIARVRFDVDCAHFVKQLRNYSQHYKIPILSQRFSLNLISNETKEYDPAYSVLLDKSKLKEWSRWNKKSLDFLEKYEELDLICLFDDYQKLIKEIYPFFDKLVNSIYKKEIEEVIKIEREMKKLYSKLDKLKDEKKSNDIKIRFSKDSN